MGRRNLAARGGNAAQVLRAVIVSDEINKFAVRRKARLGGHAVQGPGEDFGFAAAGGRDANVTGAVDEELGIGLGSYAIHLPSGDQAGESSSTGAGRDLRRVRALVGVVGGDDPDV